MTFLQHITARLTGTALVSGMILLAASASFGQQEAGSTQYFFNLYDANSAFAGNHLGISACMRYRNQWTGLDGAPVNQIISVHAPLYGTSLAGGIKILHESIGARDVIEMKTTVAYKLMLDESRLSFALTGGWLRQQLNTSNLVIKDSDDPLAAEGIWISTKPILDASLLYTTPRIYLGIEGGWLNRQPLGWTSESEARLYAHAHAVAGWMRKIGADDILQISALMRMSEVGLYQGEGSAAVLLNDLIWFGAGYRSSAGIMLFTEWNISTQLRIGYSYDKMTNGLKGIQGGSHEVFLGFTPGSRESQSIRYFH